MLIGIDEVGRGPLAGPVIACAVLWPETGDVAGLTDSKRLSAKRRESLIDAIQSTAIAIGFGRAEPWEIDQLNILQATLLAMTRAAEQILTDAPTQTRIVVDGNRVPDALRARASAVIGGDGLIPAISAASVLAKVARDHEMRAWSKTYPGYGFERHAGYPTREHLNALSCLGVTPIHRRSFAPVAHCLQENA
ncbi:MAG: ribonuclease HII [Litorivicinaceae bacterium]|nr:ribonuclease HII [Litorivicinaceae bacterium]MDP5329470.1 ribonuclease HII [Litorivicinaceae bacterium]MDP5331054.1 ribonuclease HII [Litorivicinaceae bacterium]MDP5339941.1 ribonuclease HII [Litorivicinaceae bacterium]MDP5342722.1 ribonuclease HII [Litorivicinaceae bacterium]